MSYRLDARQLNTRERILSAAAGSFSVKGFKGTTIKEIADAAALNEITVFRYFPQKQEIFWPAIDWYFRTSGLTEVFQALGRGGAPRELLLSFSNQVQRLLRKEPGLLRLLYFAALELDAEKKALFELYCKPLWNALVTRIKLWIEEGRLPTVNPALIGLIVVGTVLSEYQAEASFDLETKDDTRLALAVELMDFLLPRTLSSMEPTDPWRGQG